MSGMTTTILSHTDYPSPFGRLEIPSDKGNGNAILVNYTTLNHASKNRKLSTTAVGDAKSNWKEYVLDTLDKPKEIWCQEIINNRKFNMWRDSRNKYNIQVDIRTQGLGNGEDNEVPWGDGDVWRNLVITGGLYSLMTLTLSKLTYN